MTRTPKLPTQWVRIGKYQENASNTPAKLVRTTDWSSSSLGKIDTLNSALHRLHWKAMRPDGFEIKPLIRYRYSTDRSSRLSLSQYSQNFINQQIQPLKNQ